MIEISNFGPTFNRGRRRRLCGDSRHGYGADCGGYTSVEAALVVPTVLLLMLLMVQTLFAVLQFRNVQFAAEQAADAAARYEATNSDGELAAAEVLTQLGVSDASVTVERSVDEVTVTIAAEPLQLIPVDLEVDAAASAPIEEFLELGERS